MTSDDYRDWWDNEALVGDPRYATLAWGGDGSEEQVQPTIGMILENISLIQARLETLEPQVLEIGCGPGRILHRLARLFPFDKVFGVDISPRMLGLGDHDRPANAHVKVIDSGHFPFADGVMDLIYSVEVFQHLDADIKQAYLLEVARLLADDGLAIIQFVDGEDEDVPMNHPIPTKQMLALVKSAGLKVTRINVHHQIHDEWRWLVVRK